MQRLRQTIRKLIQLFKDFPLESIYENHLSWDRFQEIRTSNMNTIKNLLEVDPDPEDGTKATSKARFFFKSCLAKETEPTDAFMKSEIEKAGGWRWSGDKSSLSFQQRVGKIDEKYVLI